MAEFEVVALGTAASEATLAEATRGTIDTRRLREQLEEIRDDLAPLVDDQAGGRITLQEMELSVGISLEGKVWFIAKGTAEASVKLVFNRTSGAA